MSLDHVRNCGGMNHIDRLGWELDMLLQHALVTQATWERGTKFCIILCSRSGKRKETFRENVLVYSSVGHCEYNRGVPEGCAVGEGGK